MRPFFPLSVFIFFLYAIFMTCAGFGQEAHPSGSIHGSVLDAETGQPLPGANVSIPDADDGIPNVSAGIPGTTRGAAADAQGRFSIPNLAPGTYRVRVTYIGYETRIITDVVVRPARGTEVAVRLHPAAVETGEVEITAGYFASVASGDVGIAEFSGEEIRRSPGSAGDVSRIMMVLPSVAKVNDQSNSLIVRGGSPLENAFFIDGMEIPNINHFPAQGSSGGPIGLLPVDLIRDVRFSAGGFPAEYGDRLSSVMDIALREGSRDRVAAQLDLNFAGFGGLAEGPIASSGSWLVSARRSYLDLIVKAVDAGTSVAPWYGDAAAKVVVDVSPAHRLSAVALWSDDHNDPDLEAAVENDMQYYGRQDIVNATAGIAWRALWSGNVFSNTTFSFTGMRFREHFRLTANGLPVLDNDSGERWLQLRHATHLRVSPLLDVEIGGDLKRLFNRYDNRYGAVPDALGNPVPAAAFVADADNTLTGLFATASLSSWSRLTLTAGLRAQHSTWNDRIELQPRASAALALTELTTVTLSGGVYTQSLPLLLLAQDAASPALPDPRALQGVLGIAHLLTASTRLTLEGYVKQYDRFPIDPSQPELFVVDELSYRYGFFTPHARLTASGKAFSRGLELTLQKKLAQDVYGLASVAWSTARYNDALGDERPRVYDNRVLFSVEGGWKPSPEWEFSLRWIYAGGAPYTPMDVAASQDARQEVLDAGRINAARHPDYHSMNVRVDRRFNFTGSSLVIYLSVWNVYDRKNVAGYIWDDANQRVKTLYQWGLLPIFGVEWEM